MKKRSPFKLGAYEVDAGTRATIDLPVSVMSDHTPVALSVEVIHGKRPGPTMFVSAAIHGDEIIGVEIVRRLLRTQSLKRLQGTLLAIPIVNSFGFMNHSRYLPDRRDLNRTFPGSARGSLAARLANLFMTEIVERSDVGIDLHSAAIHRTNLPQIRFSSGRDQALKLAKIFGAPFMMASSVREGSLRHAAAQREVDVLLLEAGEGLRFDEFGVRVGVSGILRVMHHMGMIPSKGVTTPKSPSVFSTRSTWVRAPAGGLLRIFKSTGEEVEAGDILGIISDPFGEMETEIKVEASGLIIGRINLPVVNEGDALFHIAELAKEENAEDAIGRLSSQLDGDPLFDEDEII